MPLLYHHPLDPHSRFIRLALAEYGIEPALVEERVHERRTEFLALDPAGRTPVLVEDDGLVVPGAGLIAEYLDESAGAALDERRLLPAERSARIEVRRLLDWFNQKFFAEVSDWSVSEKIYKRFLPADRGGGAPDLSAPRVPISAIICAISATWSGGGTGSPASA
jgi:glutathione S-transferase